MFSYGRNLAFLRIPAGSAAMDSCVSARALSQIRRPRRNRPPRAMGGRARSRHQTVPVRHITPNFGAASTLARLQPLSICLRSGSSAPRTRPMAGNSPISSCGYIVVSESSSDRGTLLSASSSRSQLWLHENFLAPGRFGRRRRECTDWKDRPTVIAVDQFRRGEISRKDRGHEPHIAAGRVADAEIEPGSDSEQQEGDPQRQEHQLQRHVVTERGDPHVETEDAPDEEIPADERRRGAAAEKLFEGHERYPERAVTQERDTGEGISPEKRKNARNGLDHPAKDERHGQDDNQTLCIVPARIDHAQQPRGRGESDQPKGRRIGKFGFHRFLLNRGRCRLSLNNTGLLLWTSSDRSSHAARPFACPPVPSMLWAARRSSDASLCRGRDSPQSGQPAVFPATSTSSTTAKRASPRPPVRT